MKKILLNLCLNAIIVIISLTSCNKSRFLSVKPNQSLIVPTTLTDLQELMDNDLVINGSGNYGIVPAFGEAGSDDYYCNSDVYNSILSPLYRNIYIWNTKLYANENIFDWNFPYRAIFYSNVVLDGLDNISITPSNSATWNNIKGEALFNRGHMFYQLAQVFAPPYSQENITAALGIPLRLEADISEKIKRATLEETYDQIISDLKTSAYLLPVTPLYKTRPSKPAAYALLARVYQTMENYDTALLYADSCLNIDSSLMDYNNMDTTSYTPFPQFNKEVIFNCDLIFSGIPPFVPYIGGFVDSGLYNQYSPNDLRRSLFFKDVGNGGLSFVGTYDGNYIPFGGLATDEVYLIRAECYARNGDVNDAISDLNRLLINRYQTGTFTPLSASTPGDALKLVLMERRKELCFRGLRWTDLRRLNQDPNYAITLKREINGQVHTLPPNDPRYTYPIPDNVIGFNPKMPQNIR